MNKEIENIIKKNLPEKKEHRVFECNGGHNGKGCYEDWCDIETCISKDAMTCKGFNQALSQINTSLIADEVLKVVVDILEEKKFVKLPEEHQRRRDHTMKSGYEQCLDDIINLLTNSSTLEGEQSEHLSPNKENKNN